MATFEISLSSPSAISPSLQAQKRRVDPSSPSPGRIRYSVARFSPSSLSTGSPAKKPRVDTELKPSVAASAKSIVLPFSLLDNGHYAPITPEQTEAILGILQTVYPDALSICYTPPLLIVLCRCLPPKPWPITVAGVHVHLTTEPSDPGIYFGMPGGGRQKVFRELRLRTTDNYSNTLGLRVVEYFEEKLKLEITRVSFNGTEWSITIPDATDRRVLPQTICNAPTLYFWQKEADDNMTPASFRGKIPSNACIDDTAYGIMRPGVMLTSSPEAIGGGLGSRSTTCGILVENKATGQVGVTIATHMSPNISDIVKHPIATSPDVGHVVASIGNTDISIMRLKPGTTFVNTTFEASALNADNDLEHVDGQDLISIADHRDGKIGDTVAMNNPWNGFSEGICVGLGLLKIPQLPDIGNGTWHKVRWLSYKNGGVPLDGSCGSAIVNEYSEVLGFFRYSEFADRLRPQNGHLGIMIGAEGLTDCGWTLRTGTYTF